MPNNIISPLCALASVALIITAAHQSNAEAPACAIGDIRLHEGQLHGQVVNNQGQAVADSPVVIRQGDKVVGHTMSDECGNFVIRDLNTGMYQVEANGRATIHRVWDATIAPPAAGQGVMLVTDEEVVRGNLGHLGHLGHTGLGGVALTAAAIAAGWVIVDELDDRPGS